MSDAQITAAPPAIAPPRNFTLKQLRALALRQSETIEAAIAAVPEGMRSNALDDAAGFAALARFIDVIVSDTTPINHGSTLYEAFLDAGRRRFSK